MAFIPCNIGGGGGMTRTTLWTNNSPNSNFASQDMTLSDDITNYDYIGIKYCLSTTISQETENLITPSELQNSQHVNSYPLLTIGARISSYDYARYITYSSNTSLSISSAYRLNTAGGFSAYVIPLYVYGYKL